MESEKPVPVPLSGAEVQQAILFKVADSLEKSCHLHFDNAYTSFRAEISIKLVLSDFGREQKDNHEVKVEGDSGIPVPEHGVVNLDGKDLQVRTHTEEATVVMEPAPPNQVRVETDQEVPVKTTEGGKTTIRKVRYAARKLPKS